MAVIKRILDTVLGRTTEATPPPKSKPRQKKSRPTLPCATSDAARLHVREEKFEGESFMRQIQSVISRNTQRVWKGWSR